METRESCRGSSLPKDRLSPLKEVTIGELARLTGFNAKAIRYYEQIGVLPPGKRGENGYRHYRQADVTRLHLLRRLRLLGVSLEEAKALLVATLDAPCGEVQHDLFHLINARLEVLDQQIAELHRLREEVIGYQQELASSAVEKDEPFTACYDQSCPVCSPSSSPSLHPAQRPLTFLPRSQRDALTRERHP